MLFLAAKYTLHPCFVLVRRGVGRVEFDLVKSAIERTKKEEVIQNTAERKFARCDEVHAQTNSDLTAHGNPRPLWARSRHTAMASESGMIPAHTSWSLSLSTPAVDQPGTSIPCYQAPKGYLEILPGEVSQCLHFSRQGIRREGAHSREPLAKVLRDWHMQLVGYPNVV